MQANSNASLLNNPATSFKFIHTSHSLARTLATTCLSIVCLIVSIATWAEDKEYDLLIKGGLVFDGSGVEGKKQDIAINNDKIVRLGVINDIGAKRIVNATGLVVAPGFINTLSWATESLLIDPRSQSNIRQGVTLEVFGEGNSMGPLNNKMHKALLERQSDYEFEIPWRSLGEYLEHLENQGVSPNVASFVGATSVRRFVLGSNNITPNPQQLKQMQVAM